MDVSAVRAIQPLGIPLRQMLLRAEHSEAAAQRDRGGTRSRLRSTCHCGLVDRADGTHCARGWYGCFGRIDGMGSREVVRLYIEIDQLPSNSYGRLSGRNRQMELRNNCPGVTSLPF